MLLMYEIIQNEYDIGLNKFLETKQRNYIQKQVSTLVNSIKSPIDINNLKQENRKVLCKLIGLIGAEWSSTFISADDLK